MRSWEDRFGACPLEAGDVRIRLLVERPPRTLEEATAIAAGHWAACVSCGPDAGMEDDDRYGVSEIPGHAAVLVDSPVWTLTWD